MIEFYECVTATSAYAHNSMNASMEQVLRILLYLVEKFSILEG